jgi:hypothetical protein
MDFDFPEPYDLEVPRRIGEARQQLSPEGEEVLERLLAAMLGEEPRESPEAFVVNALLPLPRPDQAVLLRLNNLLIEAEKALASEHQGWVDFHKQMLSIIRRARELDPALKARGDRVTTGEAVEVLRRHGEPLGISDEVLEMVIWVPREE